ncbi:hypothetical protein BH23ACT4_BH23ACT4_15310 [soil metagenome]
MTVVADLITGTPFLWGAGTGLVGLLLSYGLRKLSVDWGLVWGAAVVVAFVGTGLLRGGFSGSGPRGASTPLWQVAITLLAALFAAYGIQRLRPNWVGAFAVAATIAGIWATVPDTERAAVLIGVTAAVAWAWWPAEWAAPRFAGSLIVGLLMAWVALRGGVGRETGWIGAVGSMSMLGWSALALPAMPPGLILAGHVVLVGIWSRWAGLSTSSATALVIGVTASLAVALVLHLVSRLIGRQG